MGLLALPWVWTFAETKPNVLFISIDDLNDYISPLDNHPGIKTRTSSAWLVVRLPSPTPIAHLPPATPLALR